jgi:hypothetical protein
MRVLSTIKIKWKNSSLSDRIQCFVATVLTLTLIVLVFNLIFFSKQIRLTQALNEPFCAVKEVQLIPTGTDARGKVFGLFVILKNFGNYVADNSFYELKSFAMEHEKKNDAWSLNNIKPLDIHDKKTITLMPQSELKFFVAFIQEKTLMEYVAGYEKVIGLNITIEFKNYENDIKVYRCNYLITRLQAQTNTDNPFDVMFNDNNLAKIGVSNNLK